MTGYVYCGPAEPGLTARQLDVLMLVAEDMTDVQIARSLELSVETVRTHLKRIRIQLGVSSRAGAVAKALRAGVLS